VFTIISAGIIHQDDLLLLKKGGEVVFHGALGVGSVQLVNYFEHHGASPIEHGSNPASWMLTALDDKETDWSAVYRTSEEHRILQNQVKEIMESPNEAMQISYGTIYARTFAKRNEFMYTRLKLIYWRSPVYNLGRVLMSLVISFVLASVFIKTRHKSSYTELEMQGKLSIIFLSFIIMGVLSMITILPTTVSIRDVYYRHYLAGMLESTSLTLGFGVAEKPFLIGVSTLFVTVFYFTLGLALNLRKFFAFWGFFTFNIAIYSYFGQAFMCLVPGMATAQILCSVFIGINNFFSGLIVRPQYLNGFWALPFWITPGHYVYEGLVTTQYYEDTTPVYATPLSPFFHFLNCTLDSTEEGVHTETQCVGTTEQYVYSFFGEEFQYDHIYYDAMALGAFLVAARLLTYWALKRFNYAAT
jgi:ABC-type multidrug transport system permease subunit